MRTALFLALGCGSPSELPDPLPADGPEDVDADGFSAEVDCDDNDPAVGGAMPWLADADQDGFPHAEAHTFGCDPGPGWVSATSRADTDCDDDDPSVGAAPTYRFDLDGDGFSGSTYRSEWCGEPPPGWSEVHEDCDDTDPTIWPGQIEVCDGVDNDCSGIDDDNGVCAPSPGWHFLDHDVVDAALLPSGEVLTVGEGLETLHVLDPISGKQFTHSLPFEPEHVRVSPDGSWVAVASLTELAWVSLPSGVIQGQTGLSQWPRDLAVADSRWTYVVDTLGILPLNAAFGAQERLRIDLGTEVALDPSGSHLYVNAARRYDIAKDGSLSLARTRRQSVGVWGDLVASSTGDRLYSARSSYIASEDPITDMLYAGAPASEGSPLSLSPSVQADRVFGVIGTEIVSYLPSNLSVHGTYSLPNPSAHGFHHPVDEGFTFASEATKHLVLIANVEDAPSDWAAIAVPYGHLP
ncbi:MAG: putative metal-binding motif-containing protein [Myxococcales bacterium]|nr:putative metal-binding motif-containing protein [Myxococcales bacterium]